MRLLYRIAPSIYVCARVHVRFGFVMIFNIKLNEKCAVSLTFSSIVSTFCKAIYRARVGYFIVGTKIGILHFIFQFDEMLLC